MRTLLAVLSNKGVRELNMLYMKMKGKHLESRHETVLISVPVHTDLHLCSANVRSCVLGFLSGSDFTRIVN